MQATRIVLDQSEIPTRRYDVVADMANPPAPPLVLHGQPGAPAIGGHAPIAASLKHLRRV